MAILLAKDKRLVLVPTYLGSLYLLLEFDANDFHLLGRYDEVMDAAPVFFKCFFRSALGP